MDNLIVGKIEFNLGDPLGEKKFRTMLDGVKWALVVWNFHEKLVRIINDKESGDYGTAKEMLNRIVDEMEHHGLDLNTIP